MVYYTVGTIDSWFPMGAIWDYIRFCMGGIEILGKTYKNIKKIYYTFNFCSYNTMKKEQQIR